MTTIPDGPAGVHQEELSLRTMKMLDGHWVLAIVADDGWHLTLARFLGLEEKDLFLDLLNAGIDDAEYADACAHLSGTACTDVDTWLKGFCPPKDAP